MGSAAGGTFRKLKRMMLGQETKGIPLVQAERSPTSAELSLWDQAMRLAKRANLLSYIVKLQWQNIKVIHEFAKANKIPLGEPDLPDIAERMFVVINRIEYLKDLMCQVNQLELGISLSTSGKDLDIVKPKESSSMSFGWVIPLIGAALVVAGIIGIWREKNKELEEITQKYNSVIDKADKLLCTDPSSKLCNDWKEEKKTKDYHKRETIIDSVKGALASVGKTAKKGLGWGIAILIPLLGYLYLPRRKG